MINKYLPINIFIEYFSHKNYLRKNEIDNSILKNLSLHFIENFFIFCEPDSIEDCKKITQNTKAKIILVNSRCTFQYFFDYSNKINLNKEQINIMLNNDIELTQNFENITLNDNDFYCLSRWESVEDNAPCFWACNSQDVWLWKNQNKIKNADFYLGIWACDNKLAFLAKEAGYIVTNPSYTYKAYHNHKSSIRDGSADRSLALPGPHLNVCPSKILYE